MAHVVIPLSVLPLWILAVAGVVVAFLFLVYQRGLWANTAQVFFRASLSNAFYWMLLALMIGAPDSAAASSAGRFILPLLWLRMVGLVEAFLRIASVPIPRWYRWLWIAGGLALVVAVWPAWASAYPSARLPNGLFVLSLNMSPLGILRDLIGFGGWSFVAGILLYNYRRRPTRRFLIYAWGIFLTLPLAFNDLIWGHRHPGPYPLTWVGGVLLLVVLWQELYAEVQQTYRGLNNDALTSTRSRSYAIEYAQHTLRTMSVGMLYLDVDYFKRFNDALGHDGGDMVLRAIARRVRSVLGPGDVVGRIGGDEFLIIIPGAHRGDGRLWTARVRKAVSGESVPYGGDRSPVEVRVSLGWSYGDPGSDVRYLIRQADQAMYEEKRLHHLDGPEITSEG